jgi:hypothetical protein
MQAPIAREKPETWSDRREKVRRVWMVPFAWAECGLDWVSYWLSNWRFLEVLGYLERFGVLVAVIFYFGESGDRLKQKHYQAWQVINLAAGKGGNGGRIDALEELNTDGVSLVGVDLSSAFLQGVKLKRASLARATFDGADARNAELVEADVENASLRGANFREASLQGADLHGSTLDDADLNRAQLGGADLSGTSLVNVDLRDADLGSVKWNDIRSVKGANVLGVKNAGGFVEWALAHGAVTKAGE